MRIFLFPICLFAFFLTVLSQNGIMKTFTFLELPTSASVARLGGNFISGIRQLDASLVLSNPAILTDSSNGHFAIHYDKHFAGIHYGVFSYALTVPRLGNYALHIQYLNYGKMIWTDEFGQNKGEFSAYDMALAMSWGRWFSPFFSIGANIKYAYSELFTKLSHGLCVDVSLMYFLEDKLWSVALIAKNAGFQFKPYIYKTYEPFPLDVQLATYKRLKGSPFGLSLIYHHLHKWNIYYFDSTKVSIDPVTKEPNYPTNFFRIFNTFLRHVVIGSDIFIGKFLSIGIGYNFQRRQELSYPSRRALVGLTYGISLHLRKFTLSYTRNSYYPNISPNMFTFSSAIGNWK
ncbi:MAG: type IX secretion system protein PorQ [Bacteroidales bacterium]|nr:type IX secretion system protein PorQ [Bacteroidales bacterium]